jgi:surfeit locus 1 family protein
VSGAAPARRPGPGIVLPTIAVLIVFALLLGLGKWQLDRKVWKEGLIDSVTQRLAAAPSDLPPPALWPQLTADKDEFRRVRFLGLLMPGQEARVFTSGSNFRPDVSGPGYWVLALARVFFPAEFVGTVIVVNRGFLPQGIESKAVTAGGEAIEMVGALRWPEAPGSFTPAADPAHNLWFARDVPAIVQAKNWDAPAPFYVELESPQPPDGVPRPGPLKVDLPDDHLQYALTWFGLAAVVAGSFAFWLLGRWRERQAGSPAS